MQAFDELIEGTGDSRVLHGHWNAGNILVKGAMAGALAVGGLGLAVGTAHAGGSECLQYENNANYWNDQAFIAYSNYLSTNGTAGGQPAADFYYETYQDDMSTYHYWNSKFNNCNYEAP